MGTSTIDASTPLVTLINVFSVAPERADELLELLTEATEKVIRHREGFVSANLHLSLDRRHVANYAQWRSLQDLEAMWADQQAQEHMTAATAIADAAPVVYQVASVHDASN